MVLAYETLDALTGKKALVKQGDALSCQCLTCCQNLRQSVISFMQLQPTATAQIEFVNSSGGSSLITATGAYANFNAFSRCVLNFSAGTDNVRLTVLYYPFGLSALTPGGQNYYKRWTSLLNQEQQDVEMAVQVALSVEILYASAFVTGTTRFDKSMWFTVEYRSVNSGLASPFVPFQSKIITHSAFNNAYGVVNDPLSVSYQNANGFTQSGFGSYANTGNVIGTEFYPAGLGPPYAPRPPQTPVTQYGTAEPNAFRMCLDHSTQADFSINGHQFEQSYSVIGIDDFILNFLP